MRKILGITGGVGSGKSTVLEVLEKEYGARVIQADLVARELMEPGQSSYRAVVEEFGEGILATPADGQQRGCRDLTADAGEVCPPIDRAALAAIIFADDARRIRLNELTHPLVKAEVQRRMAEAAEDLVVYESAIPVEACMRELCDEVWFVHVPVEIRIQRLTASRGYSREKCLSIMASQPGDEFFAELADRVIENGGSPEETRRQVREILES